MPSIYTVTSYSYRNSLFLKVSLSIVITLVAIGGHDLECGRSTALQVLLHKQQVHRPQGTPASLHLNHCNHFRCYSTSLEEKEERNPIVSYLNRAGSAAAMVVYTFVDPVSEVLCSSSPYYGSCL